MLAFTGVQLAERDALPPDPESNTLLESFIVHARCLHDFLWGSRNEWHPMDAFAHDFCEPGRWEHERVPWTFDDVNLGGRTGREVTHLSYDRRLVSSKEWNCGEIYEELATNVEHFANVALPTRLNEPTRQALGNLLVHGTGTGPPRWPPARSTRRSILISSMEARRTRPTRVNPSKTHGGIRRCSKFRHKVLDRAEHDPTSAERVRAARATKMSERFNIAQRLAHQPPLCQADINSSGSTKRSRRPDSNRGPLHYE